MTSDPNADLADILDDIAEALTDLCNDVPVWESCVFTLSLPQGSSAIDYTLDVHPAPARPPRLNADLRYAGIKIERYQRDRRPDLSGLRFTLSPNQERTATFSTVSTTVPTTVPTPETAEARQPDPDPTPAPEPLAEPPVEPVAGTSEVPNAASAAIGTESAATPVDYNRNLDGSRPFIDDAMEWMAHRTAAFQQWGMGTETSFEARIGHQQLVLQLPNRQLVTLPMQIVGSWAPETGLFRWGWDHEGVPAGVGQHANLVRDWADDNDFVELLTNPIPADLDRCWEFTSLALWLGQAQGAYAAEANGATVFLTLGEPDFA